MVISSAVDASARARTVGIKTTFKDLRGGNTVFLPQRIAVIGQGATAASYTTTKQTVTSAVDVGQTYGFGSPLHLAVQQLLPANGDGVGSIPVTVYPLEDNGSGIAAVGTITPSGTATATGTITLTVAGLSVPVLITTGDTVADVTASITAAVTAELNMSVTATDNSTDVDLTAKWKGTTGNDIVVGITGSVAGVTFVIVQPTGGATNPDINPALAQMGDVWETMVLNLVGDATDTATLDKINLFGEGRWGALTKKPLVSFVGSVETSVTTATTVTDARKSDRVNAQLIAPGSVNLPFVVASRQLARIAVVANNQPGRDFGSLQATGLIPGADGDQWDYLERDQAIKAGSSSSIVKDGVVTVADTVTFYHPAGDPNPAYQYVCDIVKLQNIIYNLDIRFNTPEWDGVILVPDGQAVVSPYARRPSDAKSVVASMIDGLGLNGLISDPESAKSSIQVEIDGANPKRLNIAFTVSLSGNANIISIDLNFGFYFGGVA